MGSDEKGYTSCFALGHFYVGWKVHNNLGHSLDPWHPFSYVSHLNTTCGIILRLGHSANFRQSTIQYVSDMYSHQFLQQNDLAFNILEETVCSPELGAGTKTGIGSPYHQLALQASVRSLYDLGSVAVASYNHER